MSLSARHQPRWLTCNGCGVRIFGAPQRKFCDPCNLIRVRHKAKAKRARQKAGAMRPNGRPRTRDLTKHVTLTEPIAFVDALAAMKDLRAKWTRRPLDARRAA